MTVSNNSQHFHTKFTSLYIILPEFYSMQKYHFFWPHLLTFLLSLFHVFSSVTNRSTKVYFSIPTRSGGVDTYLHAYICNIISQHMTYIDKVSKYIVLYCVIIIFFILLAYFFIVKKYQNLKIYFNF